MPVAPAGGVRHRDYDEVAGSGSDLLVAARAYVGLVRLVRLDPADLRGAGTCWVLDERVLAKGGPAGGATVRAADAVALVGRRTPRRGFPARVPVWGPSGHATDCCRPERPAGRWRTTISMKSGDSRVRLKVWDRRARPDVAGVGVVPRQVLERLADSASHASSSSAGNGLLT